MTKTEISPDPPRSGNPSQIFQMIEFLSEKVKVFSAKIEGSCHLDATGISEPAFPPTFECLIREVNSSRNVLYILLDVGYLHKSVAFQ
ncbi:hypothetical protein ACTXT7_002632 [Hymenolepis weldensis]